MPCPLCGDICRCSFPEYSAASPRWLPDASPSAFFAPQPMALDRPELKVPILTPSGEAAIPTGQLESAATESLPSASAAIESAPENVAPEENPSAWRSEVAARLNRYQARRKPRPPRYPSLRLRFESEATTVSTHPSPDSSAFSPLATTSNEALAWHEFPVITAHTPASGSLVEEDEPAQHESADSFFPQDLPLPPAPSAPSQPTAKIIQFPRSWTPAPPPLDEFAEPVANFDRPRILEAPELVPPPPALGGITIEPAPQPEIARRPGIDFPLESAPFAQRILCAAIDGAIVAVACALFGFIFWKLTAIRPPRLQLFSIAAGLFAIFCAAYQYLLLVYSRTTPGLRLAHLTLSRFDGTRPNRRLRRWRVLASFLSAVSLGMGYAWVFLDEDSLCWHDRITHTYMAPKGK